MRGDPRTEGRSQVLKIQEGSSKKQTNAVVPSSLTLGMSEHELKLYFTLLPISSLKRFGSVDLNLLLLNVAHALKKYVMLLAATSMAGFPMRPD